MYNETRWLKDSDYHNIFLVLLLCETALVWIFFDSYFWIFLSFIIIYSALKALYIVYESEKNPLVVIQLYIIILGIFLLVVNVLMYCCHKNFLSLVLYNEAYVVFIAYYVGLRIKSRKKLSTRSDIIKRVKSYVESHINFPISKRIREKMEQEALRVMPSTYWVPVYRRDGFKSSKYSFMARRSEKKPHIIQVRTVRYGGRQKIRYNGVKFFVYTRRIRRKVKNITPKQFNQLYYVKSKRVA